MTDHTPPRIKSNYTASSMKAGRGERVKFNAQFLFLILFATGCSWEYPENYPPNNADGKACRRICGEWEYFKETHPCFISCSTYPNPIGGAWCRFKCNAGIEIKSRSDIDHEEYLREIKERREYYGDDV